MKKLTQKKVAFFLLWEAHRDNPGAFLPVWKFLGEFYIRPMAQAFFMSYKGPTNGPTPLYQENPGLIERQHVTGQSGAKYYEYRLAPAWSMDMIKDEDLLEFAKLLEADKRGEIIYA